MSWFNHFKRLVFFEYYYYFKQKNYFSFFFLIASRLFPCWRHPNWMSPTCTVAVGSAWPCPQMPSLLHSQILPFITKKNPIHSPVWYYVITSLTLDLCVNYKYFLLFSLGNIPIVFSLLLSRIGMRRGRRGRMTLFTSTRGSIFI